MAVKPVCSELVSIANSLICWGMMGAKVEVLFGPHRQLQQISSTASFASTPPADFHFGVGAYETIEELRVYVPGDITPTIVQTSVATGAEASGTLVVQASKSY